MSGAHSSISYTRQLESARELLQTWDELGVRVNQTRDSGWMRQRELRQQVVDHLEHLIALSRSEKN